MTRNAALGIALVALLCGLLIGVLAGRRPGSEKPAPRFPVRKPAAASDPGPGVRQELEETARLRERIHELERRLSVVSPTEGEARKAEELHKHLSNPKLQEDLRGWMKAVGGLADLNPTMTPIFAKKYRESRPKVDGLALELALGSGGPEAAALLKEIFGNPSTPKAERVVAGICLSGDGLITRMMATVPVDPELAGLGMNALAMGDPLERQAGVGILGLQATDSARSSLQSLAVQDRDEQVRVAALRALGRVGDPSTFEYLRSYAASTYPRLFEEDEDLEKLPAVPRALARTLSRLAERFPER